MAKDTQADAEEFRRRRPRRASRNAALSPSAQRPSKRSISASSTPPSPVPYKHSRSATQRAAAFPALSETLSQAAAVPLSAAPECGARTGGCRHDPSSPSPPPAAALCSAPAPASPPIRWSAAPPMYPEQEHRPECGQFRRPHHPGRRGQGRGPRRDPRGAGPFTVFAPDQQGLRGAARRHRRHPARAGEQADADLGPHLPRRARRADRRDIEEGRAMGGSYSVKTVRAKT